jgi:hypothetical protein
MKLLEILFAPLLWILEPRMQYEIYRNKRLNRDRAVYLRVKSANPW